MSKKQALQLYELLENKRYGVSQQQIIDELGISAATFKRALKLLREQGITVFPPANNGYKLDDASRGLTNLGGQLLNEGQVGILLESYQRFSALIAADIHKETLKPILKRMRNMLNQKPQQHESIDVIHQHSRLDSSNNFKPLLQAVENLQTLNVSYNARSSGVSSRVLSPQRLLYYRENWYLIAWCHSKQDLRTFAVEKFTKIEPALQAFHKVDEQPLKAFYSQTYGIFGGLQTDIAVIQFSASVATWIQDEVWHSQQILEPQPGGSLIMHLPIGQHLTELSLDLMKYGSDVRVLQPDKLRKTLLEQHTRAVRNLGSQNEPHSE